jgi:hypothetical protein
MPINKPIILFTNFWDAAFILKKGYILIESKNKTKAIQINFIQQNNSNNYDIDTNYEVYSIALAQPKDTKLQ